MRVRVVYAAALLLCAVVLLIFVPASAHAKTGTLVLNDGRRFENVSYSVDKFYQVVKYKSKGDGTQFAVSFVEIKAILDKNGENVAPKLLGKWYRPSNDAVETPPSQGSVADEADSAAEPTVAPSESSKVLSDWRLEDDRVFVEAKKKPWWVGIRSGANISMPTGVWFDDVNTAVGYDGDFVLFLTHQIGLHFRFSRAGLKVDDDFFFTRGLIDPGLTIYNMYSRLAVNRYFLSFLYYDHLNLTQTGKTLFYVGTGAGAVEHREKGSAWATDGQYTWMISIKDTETKFATSAEIGLIFLLARNIGLDTGMSLDIIYIGRAYDEAGHEVTQTAGIFDFKLGFIYLL